jgi:hypothetical protein
MKKAPAKKRSGKPPRIDLTAYDRNLEEKQIQEKFVIDLHLDPKNPRLAEVPHTGTQASIQKVMEKEFDLQPIKDSLYRNAFFYEEPLVAVYEALPEFGATPVLVVVEGNRRLSALKSILEDHAEYPSEAARKRLEKIPVVVRTNRDETLPFVGFRHVTGIKEWEAPAKAQYAHRLVTAGYTVDRIAQLIGDKTRQVDRWIRTQSLVLRANKLGITQEDAAKGFHFSYLLTATDAPATQKWLKLRQDPAKSLLKAVDEHRLRQLWEWLYGSKQREISPVVPESRQIHKLNRVLAVPAATKELEKTGNLERADAYTLSREEYVSNVLAEVRSNLQDMHTTVYLDGPLVETKETRELVLSARTELQKISKVLQSIRNDLAL